MCGPHHCLGRDAFASGPEILRRLLQLRQNASILEQGCAGFSPGSANGCDQLARHPGRTSPPLRPSLSFRYTQVARCREQEACPVVAQKMLDIVAEGAGRSGRACVGLINRAVDLAITPTSDEVQWGVADHWSPPFETLQTHHGDCEDYAIVKFVALLQAGLSHDDVKIVILRNLLPKEDHAVVAARVDGQWLILDNRHLALLRDTEMAGSIPRFVLDKDGTRRFVPSNRAGQGPSAGRSSPARFVRPA